MPRGLLHCQSYKGFPLPSNPSPASNLQFPHLLPLDLDLGAHMIGADPILRLADLEP